MQDEEVRPPRRAFMGQLGLMAFAMSMPRGLPHTEITHQETSTWDMSWVERVSAAPYKVVIDATKIEGDALYTALDVMDTFHEVYGTPDDQTRVVVVMRHFGAAMGLSDALWERYAIGEERSVTDPETKAPARRNPFLRATATAKEAWELNSKIEPLVARGVTILVCNRAAMGLASALAKRANKPVEEVQADIKAGLVPGAYLMPNGVFALIRAQNAGCAFSGIHNDAHYCPTLDAGVDDAICRDHPTASADGRLSAAARGPCPEAAKCYARRWSDGDAIRAAHH